MERNDLEAAISRLTELLADQGHPESAYQALFEDHPSILEVLGFAQVQPHPHLRRGDGEGSLIPDFIARRASGPATIIDLKTPEETIIRYQRNRPRFRASMTEYLSQLVTYGDYFDDREAAEAFHAEYGIEVWKDPPLLLIAGFELDAEREEIHRQLADNANPIELMSYDDVLRTLMNVYGNLFGRANLMTGATFLCGCRVYNHASGSRQYLVDLGDSPRHNRWSVYFDSNGQLTLELRDRIGRSYSVSVPSDVWQPGVATYLAAEFSNGADGAELRISFEDRIAAVARVGQRIEISGGLDFSDRVIGASIEKSEGVSMEFFGGGITPGTMSPLERTTALQQLRRMTGR